MCFSATASFTASATLTILGLLACKKAQKWPTLLLALSPLIFAIQQATEGFVWLSLTNPAWQSFQTPATYMFLFFALAWWPSWIPLILTLIEPNILRKKILINTLAFGFLYSLYMLSCLIYYGSNAFIANWHIGYTVTCPGEPYSFLGTLYLIPTVLPFFISTIGGMNILGSTLAFACLLSYLFYTLCFLSTWCFFAAVLSAIILAIVTRMEKK